MSFDEVISMARARRGLPAPVTRRLIRESAKLTQQEIATQVGVHQATVARWENGDRSPRRDALDRYVALLERLQREVLS
jgi:HTH-type transcriptional regulator/antitoxin MqsA